MIGSIQKWYEICIGLDINYLMWIVAGASHGRRQLPSGRQVTATAAEGLDQAVTVSLLFSAPGKSNRYYLDNSKMYNVVNITLLCQLYR
jgi:hypothetical protein